MSHNEDNWFDWIDFKKKNSLRLKVEIVYS